jgi:GTP pyrophosphokinase
MIVGYPSQGKGIVVHRNNCKSIKHTKPNDETIDLQWSESVDNNFSASIMIEVENQRGVLSRGISPGCTE